MRVGPKRRRYLKVLQVLKANLLSLLVIDSRQNVKELRGADVRVDWAPEAAKLVRIELEIAHASKCASQ